MYILKGLTKMKYEDVNVKTLQQKLDEGLTTISLFDEDEGWCFGESVINIADCIRDIKKQGYYESEGEQFNADGEENLTVGSGSYNVFYTKEEAINFCLCYMNEEDCGYEEVYTREECLSNSYWIGKS